MYKDYYYNYYDALGRVYETGRVRKFTGAQVVSGIIWDYNDFLTWMTQGSPYFFEAYRTYYDDIIPGSSTALSPYFPNPDGTNGQANLRNRVASVTVEDTRDSDPLTYNYATHYSYDVSGNVKQVVHDIPELNIGAGANHRYKRITYDYDLVSGKVNYVYYQKDSVDQFVHHYVYDTDNRVQFVETSRDGLVWERDANYEYYLHGPLGRTELGERRVQGLDYAYTLQGWLKGLNASTLRTDTIAISADFNTRDMGLDGKSSNSGDFARTKNVARDVAAFTLGYYRGDYRMVNTTLSNRFELQYATTATFHTAAPDLFNGNIRHAVYSIANINMSPAIAKPEGYAYRYDQLNRLVSMRAYNNYTLGSTFSWNTSGGALVQLRENVKYDPNGNITSYVRYGNRDSRFVKIHNVNFNL